jgi:hypothetical protein
MGQNFGRHPNREGSCGLESRSVRDSFAVSVCRGHNLDSGRIDTSRGRAPYRPVKLVVRFNYSKLLLDKSV